VFGTRSCKKHNNLRKFTTSKGGSLKSEVGRVSLISSGEEECRGKEYTFPKEKKKARVGETPGPESEQIQRSSRNRNLTKRGTPKGKRAKTLSYKTKTTNGKGKRI